MADATDKNDSLNTPSRKGDKVSTEKFILFNLAFVLLIAAAVNTLEYFPQSRPILKKSLEAQAASGSPAKQASQWQGGRLRRQLEQEQQEFIDQTKEIDTFDQLDYFEHLQQPLLKQSLNQNPVKVKIQEDCYFTCRKQEGQNSQYCQSMCTY